MIVASQAWAAGKLLAATDAALGDELNAIPYSSSITVNLVFDEAQLGPLARWVRLPCSGCGRARNAGVHVCASEVCRAHTDGQSGSAGISRRCKERSSAGSD